MGGAHELVNSKVKEETKVARRQNGRKRARLNDPLDSSCDESQSSGFLQSLCPASSQDDNNPHANSGYDFQPTDPRLVAPTAPMGCGTDNHDSFPLPLPTPTANGVSDPVHGNTGFSLAWTLNGISQSLANANDVCYPSPANYLGNGVNLFTEGLPIALPFQGNDQVGTLQEGEIANESFDEHLASTLLTFDDTSNFDEDEASAATDPSYQPKKKNKKASRKEEIKLLRDQREKENREIKHLRTVDLKSWGEISDILNETRQNLGITERLSEAAVYGRFARNAKELARKDGDASFDPQDYMHLRVKRADDNSEERLKRLVDVRDGATGEKSATQGSEQSEQQQPQQQQQRPAAMPSRMPTRYVPIAPKPAELPVVLNAQEVRALNQAFGESQRQFWQNVSQNFLALTGRQIEPKECYRLWQQHTSDVTGKNGTV